MLIQSLQLAHTLVCVQLILQRPCRRCSDDISTDGKGGSHSMPPHTLRPIFDLWGDPPG
jgi:hypothetical protein